VTLPTPRAPLPPALGWRVEQRSGSGQYVISERGALLFRVDRASGTLYLWDKRSQSEVPIKLSELAALCGTT
jgi:hypothetical protein